MRHHAIVVTTYDPDLVRTIHRKAKKIFGALVSNIKESDTNIYFSFFISPDGSKEGWGASEQRDKDRKEFTDYLNSKAYDDGSNPVQYIEVYYGDDNGEVGIVRSN